MTRSTRYLIHPDGEAACRAVAHEIAALIRSRAAENRVLVLGLATGSTPLPLYREWIRLHREEGLSFSNVISFNLDEYSGLPPGHPRSYRTFMWEQLLGQVDMPVENFHIPRGDMTEGGAYEAEIRAAGGIDFQILGIGRTGHIGFNEPGSSISSRTRLVHLDPVTRADAAAAFSGLENVPSSAITMGCGTILDARKIALLAWGAQKAEIVCKSLTRAMTPEIPATFLQSHPDCLFHLDPAAAAMISAAERPL